MASIKIVVVETKTIFIPTTVLKNFYNLVMYKLKILYRHGTNLMK